MEFIVPLLTSAGISPSAAKVYLTLLELGRSSADSIAKRAGMYKANTYDALQRLQEQGFVTTLTEANKRFFVPTSPEKLPQLVDEQKKQQDAQLDTLKEELQKILPQLQAKYESIKETELFEVYRGRKAYKAVLNEISAEKPREWKGFGNLQVQEYFPVEFQRWFKHVHIRLFSQQQTAVQKRLIEARKTSNAEICWLPKEIFMPIVWTIYGKNLLIIMYEPDIILLRIQSTDVVKTFSQQFEYLWKKNKK